MPGRRLRPRLSRLALLPLFVLAACATGGQQSRLAQPAGREFFANPARFAGSRVRLRDMRALHLELTRPLVFARFSSPADELAVTDGRSLAGRLGIREGEVVDVIFDCNEGLNTHGNLLLSIERPFRAE